MLTPLLARLRGSTRNVRKPRRPPNPSEAAKTLEYEFNMLVCLVRTDFTCTEGVPLTRRVGSWNRGHARTSRRY